MHKTKSTDGLDTIFYGYICNIMYTYQHKLNYFLFGLSIIVFFGIEGNVALDKNPGP